MAKFLIGANMALVGATGIASEVCPPTPDPLASLQSQASEVCPPTPDPLASLQSQVNSCGLLEAARTQYDCPSCPTVAALTEMTADVIGSHDPDSYYDSCFKKMQPYYCRHSPFRALSVYERYERIMEIAAQIDSWIPKEVVPCYAAEETLDLDPLYKGCRSKTDTGTGFSQYTYSSFANLFGNTPSDRAKFMAKYPWMAPYRCAGSPRATDSLRTLYQKYYPQDPVMQVGIVLRDLELKDVTIRIAARDQARANGQKRKAAEMTAALRLRWDYPETRDQITSPDNAYLRQLVMKSNGGPSRSHIADKVMSCTGCLQRLKAGGSSRPEEVLACLHLASGETYTLEPLCPSLNALGKR